MDPPHSSNVRLLLGSLALGLLFNVVPIGFQYAWLRPEWLVLLIVYWEIRMPADFGIGFAWMVGLVLDGFEGSLLGQHALAMAVVAYLTIILHRRLSLFSTGQQCVVLFVLVGVFQLLCHWVQNLSGVTTPNLLFLVSCLSSALCWPLVRFGLDRQLR